MADTLNFAQSPELTALARDARPAWLWSPSGHRIVWANRTGLAFWGFGSLSALASRDAPSQSHGFRHLDRLSEELETGRARVDRLRFFRHGRDVLLTCKISALNFDGAKYLLAVSMSPIANLPVIDTMDDDGVEAAIPQDEEGIAGNQIESDDQLEAMDEAGEYLDEMAEITDPPASDDLDDDQAILDDVVESAVGALDALLGANIVPFRNSETRTGSDESQLTGDEQEAFQAIANALDGDGVAPDLADESEPSEAGPHEDNDTRWLEIKTLIDNLSVACFVYRAAGEENDPTPYFASSAYLDLFGYDSMDDAIAAGGVAALLPATLTPDDLSGDRQTVTITTKSGANIPVLARIHAINWQGAGAVMMTLTDRMPEEATEPSATTDGVDLARAFDRAFEAAIILDDAGNILHANVAAIELFNLEDGGQDELTLVNLLESNADETAGDLLERFRDTQDHAQRTGLEVTGKVYGGADLPLNMILRDLPESGSTATHCATFTDISRWRDAAAAEARARAVAEDANDQKSEFLSGISHEIRTSLNPVLGFSEAIIEERFGPLEHKQYTEYVQNIHDSGTHLLGLVNDMLDLSKIEAGQAELNFASVDLNEVAAGCVKMMQPDANKERIIIRSNLAIDMPEIVADQQSLRQIALNLLSNAVKYTGPGGQVIVSTRMTDAGEQQLRVRDTGRGMSDEELDTALKPFGRAETVRGEIEGTGLGLPLTHALIEANRARFSIESAVGEGTLVEVTFPVNRVLAS
jgi:signal transduction histidine kinase